MTLRAAGIAHPPTEHAAPWLPIPALEPPLVLKPRFGSWGRDVIRCDTPAEIERGLEAVRHRLWFGATGGVLQKLVPPCGYDLRIVVACGRVAGAVLRRARAGEWRTNVALGARRASVVPPMEACRLALGAAAASARISPAWTSSRPTEAGPCSRRTARSTSPAATPSRATCSRRSGRRSSSATASRRSRGCYP